MNCGEVVLAQVQQADGQLKPRPVVVLNQMPPFGDFLVCALSSRLYHECQGFDEVIDVKSDDYSQSGLKVPLLIRLGMVATLPKPAILGPMGAISKERLHRLRLKLAAHIKAEQADDGARE